MHRLLRVVGDAAHVDEVAHEPALFQIGMHDADAIRRGGPKFVEIRRLRQKFAGGFIDPTVGVIGAIWIRFIEIGTIHGHMVHYDQLQSGLPQNR